MSRRKRRDTNQGMGYIVPIIGMIVLIAGIAFVSSYLIYGNKLSSRENFVNRNNIMSARIDNSSNITNEQIAETSSQMGKTVNELTNTQNNNEVEKRAINTSNIEENELAEREEKEEITKEDEELEEETQSTNANEQKVFTFERPVEGEIIKDYSDSKLIYSNTLNEWTVHMGIDYRAEKTSIVKAAEEGTIKSIKNDPRYGLTVVISHENGFETMYANLLSTEFITVGEKVEKGQTIATVGNTASFEAADETHLHFEMSKNGKIVDPNLYIK